MPRFYFNVHTPVQQVTDLVGEECRTTAEALRRAREEASDLIQSALWRDDFLIEGWIEIEDEEHRPVSALPLRQMAV